MANDAPIKGFVIKDASGVVAVIPANHKGSQAQELAWDYIRKNKVLQTLWPEPLEELFDFTLRVDAAATEWREKLRRGQGAN